jgi:hypothetical protein
LLAALAADRRSGLSPGDGPVEAERAMSALHQAITVGYRHIEKLRTDSDLDSLRSRTDFQLLLMDLAFPPDPFVRDN